MDDVVVLEGIELPASLGVSEAERQLRRPVRIDLELTCSSGGGEGGERPGATDRLEHAVDYSKVYGVVADVVAAEEYRLVEALAERIAAALLASFEIRSVTVSVRKPTPLAGSLRHAGIRISWAGRRKKKAIS